MPRVASFDGIDIYVYAADHNPPHVHAFYAECEALLAIKTRDLLAGSLPGRQLRAAKDWVAENESRLLAKWDELNE